MIIITNYIIEVTKTKEEIKQYLVPCDYNNMTLTINDALDLIKKSIDCNQLNEFKEFDKRETSESTVIKFCGIHPGGSPRNAIRLPSGDKK